jgi:hypothetical protein
LFSTAKHFIFTETRSEGFSRINALQNHAGGIAVRRRYSGYSIKADSSSETFELSN